MRKPFKMKIHVSWRLQRIYSPQLNFNIILRQDDLYSIESIIGDCMYKARPISASPFLLGEQRFQKSWKLSNKIASRIIRKIEVTVNEWLLDD